MTKDGGGGTQVNANTATGEHVQTVKLVENSAGGLVDRRNNGETVGTRQLL